ncbi:cytochrome b/b6 domain-containing protein [Bacillus sp. V3B]|uniref:formate dehydrogenase subunit gamma n=1 Tax=Bacillus sp. V3B TaxID=2804915 RepID=UPI00210976E4|nr:cytochrome b/b6 domain-containing protein [Bacillus sp. V3B]MCQ6274535.1 cytochrome b/b6 domain-containing protein [Bacillus sp. V3B]
MSNGQPKKIRRFTVQFIIFHWAYALAFLILYLTGLAMYTEFFDWMYVMFGGSAMARLIHRISAVLFILSPIYLLIFDRKSFGHWIKQVVTWRKDDILFLLSFPKELFFGKADAPKQDFYNGGEKLNSAMQIVSFFLFVASGIVMWFPQYFAGWIIDWSYPIHSIAVAMSTMVVVGHIYLSVGHPNSRVSIEGMTTGMVPEKFAEHHHGRWYDELKEEEKKKQEQDKNQNKGA